MKVAIFDGSFQTATFIQRLITGLVNCGVEVYVLGFNESLAKPLPKVTYVALGSNQSFVRLVQTSLHYGFAYSWKKGIKAIMYLLQKNKKQLQQQNLELALQKIQPDIIHAQWIGVLPWLEPFLKKQTYKIILSERGYHVNVKPFIDASYLKYLQKWYPYIAGFHSVSKAMTQVSNTIYHSPHKVVKVVYTGLNLEEYPFNQVLPKNPCLHIISVGRPHWIKGYDIALRAMHQLKLKHIHFKYLIIGVQNNEELLFLRDDLGLHNQVEFLGKRPHQEIKELMSSADLLLLPSIEEGIANVVVEAMALGTPVIFTNCGGMQELITHEKEGWIVPIRNPEAMAEQIEDFTQKAKENIVNVKWTARKKVEHQHNEQKMVVDMITLYEKVLNNTVV